MEKETFQIQKRKKIKFETKKDFVMIAPNVKQTHWEKLSYEVSEMTGLLRIFTVNVKGRWFEKNDRVNIVGFMTLSITSLSITNSA
jgi:hypothetical protein